MLTRVENDGLQPRAGPVKVIQPLPEQKFADARAVASALNHPPAQPAHLTLYKNAATRNQPAFIRHNEVVVRASL